eukprot:scaffold177861_cov22-Tisochrysis_lutea.AAC.2
MSGGAAHAGLSLLQGALLCSYIEHASEGHRCAHDHVHSEHALVKGAGLREPQEWQSSQHEHQAHQEPTRSHARKVDSTVPSITGPGTSRADATTSHENGAMAHTFTRTHARARTHTHTHAHARTHARTRAISCMMHITLTAQTIINATRSPTTGAVVGHERCGNPEEGGCSPRDRRDSDVHVRDWSNRQIGRGCPEEALRTSASFS